jgi:hypothetical protein
MTSKYLSWGHNSTIRSGKTLNLFATTTWAAVQPEGILPLCYPNQEKNESCSKLYFKCPSKHIWELSSLVDNSIIDLVKLFAHFPWKLVHKPLPFSNLPHQATQRQTFVEKVINKISAYIMSQLPTTSTVHIYSLFHCQRISSCPI